MSKLPTSTGLAGLEIYARLLTYLRPLIPAFALSIFGYLLFAASQPALAKLMEVLVNAIETKDADARFYIPALIIGIYFIRGIGSFMGSYFMAWVGTRIVVTLRMEMFEHILHLPASYFDNNNSGKITSRIIFNTGLVTGAATDALKTVIREGFTVVGLLIFALYINWKMTIIFLTVAPFIGVIVVFVGKKLRKLSTRVQNSVADITHICTETLSANRTVKSLLAEKRESQRFHRANERNLRQQMSMVRIQSFATPALQTLVIVAMGVIVSLMLQPHFLETMNTGQYVSYITAIALIPKPVKQLGNVIAVVQKGIAAADSLFEVLDIPREANPGTIKVKRFKGHIKVRNLSFTYPGASHAALNDISFEAMPGQKIALVGRSGSGKSTLASLLLRYYEYDLGVIEVDGKDIREYDLYDYRRNIGTVNQGISLFNDTIGANISYGELSESPPDDELIKAAAENANAKGFIDALPQGFNTLIGENGAKLSGGQKQRIAIARTLIKDTAMLVLDEATSALDNESERAIQNALNKFTENRTTIIIAHRLSTIESADQILVMDQGEIRERGTHHELISLNGYYTQLYQRGFEE